MENNFFAYVYVQSIIFNIHSLMVEVKNNYIIYSNMGNFI
jgi:hypothetical protein